MKVLTVTHSWPNSNNNTKGSFVEDETALLSDVTEQKILFLQSLDPKGSRSGTPIPSSRNIPLSVRKYISFPKRLFPKLTAKSIAYQIKKEASLFKPDIIHIHFLYPGGICLPYLPEYLQKKTVITIHGSVWFTLKESSIFALYFKQLDLSSAIICVSDELKADVSAFYPQIAQKVFAVPHGISTQQFNVTSEIRSKDFISVGGISPVKGHDLTLKAIASTPRLRDFTFSIIGSLVDIQYQNELLQIISTENLTNVSFLPTVHRDNMADIYNQYSTFVLPSRNEGFGISFIEAGACGCSLIGPNGGGPASIINEEVGDKIDKEDIEMLSKALLKHAEKNFDRTKIHKSIAKRYSLESKKNKQLSVYKKIIASN